MKRLDLLFVLHRSNGSITNKDGPATTKWESLLFLRSLSAFCRFVKEGAGIYRKSYLIAFIIARHKHRAEMTIGSKGFQLISSINHFWEWPKGKQVQTPFLFLFFIFLPSTGTKGSFLCIRSMFLAMNWERQTNMRRGRNWGTWSGL